MIKVASTDEREGTLRDLAPDLTPMLDVIFILLIFFILTANGSFRALDLALPQKGAELAPVMKENKHIVLEISNQNDYTLDGKNIASFVQLKHAVKQSIGEKPEHELVIAGDKSVTIERLLEVLTFLNAEGVNAANILMQKEE